MTSPDDLGQVFGPKRTEPQNTTQTQDQDEIPGAVRQLALGMKVPKPTQRILGMEGVKIRVSPVSSMMWEIVSHYDKLLKKDIECFGQECCRVNDAVKIRYIIPVVEYTTDRDGNVVSRQFGVNYFRLGSSDYENLANLLSQIKDPTRTDFLATCSSTKYNTFDFVDIRNEEAVWRQYPEFEQEVLEKAQKVLGLMVPLEVKRYSREEYLQMRAAASGQAPQTQPASGVKLGDRIGR